MHEKEPVEEPSESLDGMDFYEAMESLLHRAPKDDVSPLEKSLRKWYRDDFKGYMARMIALRIEKLKAGTSSSLPEQTGPSVEEVPLRELLERIIEKAEEESQ